MAILRKGFSDGFTGKTGSTVTYLLHGKMVKRTIGKSDKAPTALQLAVRQRTSIMAAFLRPIKEIIKIGFELEGKGVQKDFYSMASSYNRLNAITGEFPNQKVNCTKVLFSKGEIPVIPSPVITVEEKGIRFDWDAKFIADGIKTTDQAMLIAYLPDRQVTFHLVNAAKRSAGTAFLPLPKDTIPLKVETYISFIAENHKSISDSLYAGQVSW